jgi:hypothetical protein
MRNRMLLALMIVVSMAASAATAQSTAEVPRLADGRPDLQGVWDFRTITPLERPPELGDKAVLTAEEAAALQAAAVRVDEEPPPGEVGAYNQFWFDQGAAVVEGLRTSLLTDPPNGRLPALVPGALHQIGSYGRDMPGERPIRYRGGGSDPISYEDRGLAERCLLGFNAGPPVLPAGYNQNIQVFQTADYVVLFHEMVHDTRIVPLTGSPHLADDIRQWMGDSRGYWDGDTLVIESTNFSDKTASFNDTITSAMGTGLTLHLTERLRRVDADTLEYEFTINDPETFSRPFTGMIPMAKSSEPVYEYACHEGNYGLPNQLAGARMEELKAGTALSTER